MSIVKILRSVTPGHIPAVAVTATGSISFSVNPTNNDTITLGGTKVTFVSGGNTGNEVLIGTDLPTTLASLLTLLSDSQDAAISLCTYAINSNILKISYGIQSSEGNTFTLAASAATPSGAVLTGGVDGIQTGRIAINEADGVFFWLNSDGVTVESHSFNSPTAPTQEAGDNSTHISTTAFVAAAIAAILGSPPSNLNTLQKIAAAINNDANAYNDLYAMIIAGSANGLNYTPQSLTSGQQAQVFTNLALLANFISFAAAQTLTSGQQTQLWANIGLAAAVAADVQTGTSSSAFITPAALAGSAAEQSLTYGSTISWDMSKGYNAKVTLTGNPASIAAPTNAIAGFTYVLRIIQDATGSRTIAGSAWASCFDWGGPGTPTLSTSANSFDLLTAYCVVGGGSPKFACSILRGF